VKRPFCLEASLRQTTIGIPPPLCSLCRLVLHCDRSCVKQVSEASKSARRSKKVYVVYGGPPSHIFICTLTNSRCKIKAAYSILTEFIRDLRTVRRDGPTMSVIERAHR
jgi:hypothetical protein